MGLVKSHSFGRHLLSFALLFILELGQDDGGGDHAVTNILMHVPHKDLMLGVPTRSGLPIVSSKLEKKDTPEY